MQRLPNEVKKKLNISRFQASLKDIMKYDTDGDPLNAFVKHIEVITAALGTTFVDITRLKKSSTSRTLTRPEKWLKPPFRPATVVSSAFTVSHEANATTHTEMKDSAPSPRMTVAAVSGGNHTADLFLPSRVEEHSTPVREPPSPGSARNHLQPSASTKVGWTRDATAAWGEEMLRKCEETLRLLHRIEQDAKQIL